MKFRTILFAIAACFAITISSYSASWEGSRETGWRVRLDDGTYVTNQWFKDLTDDSWYYFDSNSIMQHDCWIDGKYYVGSDGRMWTNTTTSDGYYVGADGAWIPSTDSVSNSKKQQFNELVRVLKDAYESNSTSDTRFEVSGNEDTEVITLSVFMKDPRMDKYSDEMCLALARTALDDSFYEVGRTMRSVYGDTLIFGVIYCLNDRVLGFKVY